MPAPNFKAKHFFLNQRYELPVEDQSGGGGVRYYAQVAWAEKGTKVRQSIQHIKAHARASRDPLRGKRFFIVAAPELNLRRQPGKRSASQEPYVENVDFGGEHAQCFGKLGLDLLAIHRDGTATVHADASRIEQIEAWAAAFETMGVRDKSRWAGIAKFDVIPLQAKVDERWLATMQSPGEAYIELQPLLDRHEVSEVIREIESVLRQRRGESLLSVSHDYSGRVWLSAKLAAPAIREIAESFSSVDSIHRPLVCFPCADSPRLFKSDMQPAVAPLPQGRNPKSLPCVAVVDTGVKQQHMQLEPFQLGIQLGEACQLDPWEPHGTEVASRIIFGDMQREQATQPLLAACSYFNVGLTAGREPTTGKTVMHAKDVVPAMAAVVRQARDVRVFNLSIDADKSLADMDEQERRNVIKMVEDLDNFVFENDVIVVVAAGNSDLGALPNTPYPRHVGDERWKLRSWSRSFNALTCGGTVPRVCEGAVAHRANAPSPFSRIGPGFADAPKPDFCAQAGDCRADYRPVAGGGVLALDESGYVVETMGTSFAAPLLAREAALALDYLQRHHRPEGGRILAVTVKAFLAATARLPELPAGFKPLVKRALGRGFASADDVRIPSERSTRFVWQGYVPSRSQKVRVQIPIPKAWLTAAQQPELRVTCASDSPAHASVLGVWASRKVNLSLFANPEREKKATEGETTDRRPPGSSDTVGAYPLFQRWFDLSKHAAFEAPETDFWILRITYSETEAGYRPGPAMVTHQRVAFVAELHDEGRGPSPQESLQALNLNADFLSSCVADIATPLAVAP